MSYISLLEIDPDKLFIEYNIKEIQEIDKKIRLEIEKKRQELRCMVGERYRDVLTAANTIQLMQHSAETFKMHVNEINNKCYYIQSKTQPDKPAVVSVNKFKNFYQSVAIQIKILILIPEIFWMCLDTGEYLKAVQIYLFAIHINTGLELDTEHKVLDKFPILSRLKLSINLFRNRILDGLTNKLMQIKLEPQETTQHICAYILLENKTQEEALKYFIHLRHQSLLQLVNSEVTLHSAVRSRILDLIHCLMCTVNLFNACFVSDTNADKSHLVKKNLELALQKDGECIMNMMELEKTSLFDYIPAIVKQFKPECKEFHVELPDDVLQIVLNNWLDLTRTTLNTYLSKSLEHVTSVKVLYNIREEINNIETQNHWKQDNLELYLPKDFNVWHYFIQPLISKRAEDLVKHKIKSNLKIIFVNITNYLKTCKKTDEDLKQFVWNEDADDLGKDSNLQGKLSIKTKGYSSKIVELCQTLDKIYCELLQDVSLYLYGAVDSQEQQTTEGKKLEFYLREAGSFSIDQLVLHVEKEIEKRGDEYVLVGARLFQAISQLCPNLKKCCSTTNQMQDWDKVLEKLNSHCLNFWSVWLQDTKIHIENMADKYLLQDITFYNILYVFPKWDVIEIEEQTEDKIIKSQIKLPTHPSVSLVKLLSAVLTDLDNIVPHTIPKTVHDQFIDILVTVIFDHYEKLSTKEDVSQNLAIQLLLDVKFVTLICVRRNCKTLTARSQTINENLRSKVDPFDLNVFYSYLQTCIKRSVLQMNVLFGCLLGSTSQFSTIGTQEQPNLSTDREPTILPYSMQHNDVWFPLLPVTTPIAKSFMSNMSSQAVATPNPVNQTQQRHSSPTAGNFVRSGAAALLADWFS